VVRKTRAVLIVAALAAAIGAVGQAPAGVVSWQAWWMDQSPIGDWNWSFNYETLVWDINEQYIGTYGDGSASRTLIETDSDPIIHVIKNVSNNSTFEWTDYHVEITGSAGVSYVPGSAASDRFLTIVENGNQIDFFAPNSVPIGDSVTIEFDIMIPEGNFSFDIHQMPTPEPASALLLGLGMLVLRRR